MKDKHGNQWARRLPVGQGCLVFRKDHQRQYTYFRNFLSVNLFQNWKKNSKTRIWRYEPFVKLSTIYLSKDIVCRSEFSSFLSWFISTPDSKQKIMAMHMDNAHHENLFKERSSRLPEIYCKNFAKFKPCTKWWLCPLTLEHTFEISELRIYNQDNSTPSILMVIMSLLCSVLGKKISKLT